MAIAKAEGFNMTTEDFHKAQSELVDAEPEAAAGCINEIFNRGSEVYEIRDMDMNNKPTHDSRLD